MARATPNENDMLFNAAEARELAEKGEGEELLMLKRKVAQKIRVAANDNQFTATINCVPLKRHKHMKQWLESKGYKVDCGSAQRDGEWFHVSW